MGKFKERTIQAAATRAYAPGYGWRSFKAKNHFQSGLNLPSLPCPVWSSVQSQEAASAVQVHGDLCDYGDILKKLAYNVYRKQEIRNAIFDKLGHSTPSTVASYRRFVRKEERWRVTVAQEVLDAYLDLKEAGRLGLTT